MAIAMKFDSNHNVIQPTIVLTTKSGARIGKIPAVNIVFKDGLSEYSEMSFRVYKPDCEWVCSEYKDAFWDKIIDFRLGWVRDWDMYFELDVEVNQSNDTVKVVTARSLAESELSQLKLFGLEVNTETDIERDDYSPTVLYNSSNKKVSLLDRMLEKAPHFSVGHVDRSIASIQRTFSFDDEDIYGAMQEVGEEINCVFTMIASTDTDGKIRRTVNAYDLESSCNACGTRGEFIDRCSECGSTDISLGYGEDTTILCTTENLADSVTYTTDNDSVKNCFRLEAGDDLMTATVASMNPNGSQYIWHISEEMKEDMSDDLKAALSEYDERYAAYRNSNIYTMTAGIRTAYNALASKYTTQSRSFPSIPSTINGYSGIIEAYYNAIDLYYYLSHEMMPDATMISTTAAAEASKLAMQSSGLSPVAVKSISSASASTVSSAVLSMAKVIVDNRYGVAITTSSYVNGTWVGKFKITNVSNEDDTAETSSITVRVNEDIEKYIKQKLDISLNKSVASEDITDIVTLFDLSLDEFTLELKKYGMSRLTSFYDSCRGGIDILTEQGVSNKSQQPDLGLYDSIYTPYFEKYQAIEAEMALRDSELNTIAGVYDEDGMVIADGVETLLMKERRRIQGLLNLEEFLKRDPTKDLWTELSTYRRDDVYSNDNYISDGLSNAELFEKANQFVRVAEREIGKASLLQGSITANMKNLLVIKEFAPIVDYFSIGNWIRVRVDDTVYRLRIVHYEIDFDKLSNIAVTFSEVKKYEMYVTDIASILDKASSMASTYEYVARQANKGSAGNDKLRDWVNNGLDLTKMKIIDNADNQNITIDSHGLLGRELNTDTGKYDPKQLKLINKGLYVTDDAWETSRAGIGEFIYYDPKTGEFRDAYGVIADTIVGNIILSREVGVYTEKGNISMDQDGLTIVADKTDNTTDVTKLMTIVKKYLDGNGNEKEVKVFQIDSNGNLVFNGESVKFSVSGSDKTVDDVMGAAANAITRVDVEYAIGDSATVAPTTGWSTVAPVWQDGKYMWQRTASYKGGSDTPTYSDATNISGAKGADGDGVGIESLTEIYYLSTNYNGSNPPSAPTSEVTNTSDTVNIWTLSMPTYRDGAVYFTSSQISYSDGTMNWSTPTASLWLTTSSSEVGKITSNVNALTTDLRDVKNKYTEIDTVAGELNVQIGTVTSDLNGVLNTLNTYFKFDSDGLHIAKSGSDAEMQIVNDMINILVAGVNAMTLDRTGLRADVANIANLVLGMYQFSYNPQNKHLTLS